MSYELEKIIKWLNFYKESTGCKGVVYGLSGGKDSTVVAMLCKMVWGDNALAVLMPNHVQPDIEDSYEIAHSLEIDYTVVNIRDAFCGILDNSPIDISLQAQTNIAPRIRMTVLYAIAQTLGYQVCGSGNKSEGYIGWCTKNADANGYDFNPIGHLTCSEVIKIGLELAEIYELDKKFIIKTPSDGLTGKSDEDNFGFSYAQLDEYIENGTTGDEKLDKKIARMHNLSEHKRHMPPIVE